MSGKRRDPKRIEIRAWKYLDQDDLRWAIKVIGLFGFKAVIENGKTATNDLTFVLYAEEVRKV